MSTTPTTTPRTPNTTPRPASLGSETTPGSDHSNPDLLASSARTLPRPSQLLNTPPAEPAVPERLTTPVVHFFCV
eukprot:NODE_15676_length_321_cov_5.205882_g14510_i0.p1 GENE.NODE_15676_length_321_cov_5.205882_g14510_i0~~NODE_15676_length_321_cov_5.205882_g14510_i0.p1  ORF type:complete len:75 (+),score=6.53 NODE_15676_length_321_cov_5.205882_g14510_i0:3-227(+)